MSNSREQLQALALSSLASGWRVRQELATVHLDGIVRSALLMRDAVLAAVR